MRLPQQSCSPTHTQQSCDKVCYNCYSHTQDKKSNEEKPSPKGISLPPDQWARLCAGLPKLVAALAEGSEDCEVPLGSLRKAYVSKYK